MLLSLPKSSTCSKADGNNVNTGMINPEDISNLRSRVPIEDIIGEYVTLKRAGTNLTGLCPFHDESTPSFSVSPDRGLFHCFGCQESGDTITFVRKIEDLSFVEAVQKIADKAGIQLRYVEGSGASNTSSTKRKQLIEAHRKAVEIYQKALYNNPDAAPGKAYLTERQFTEEHIEQFSIGYSPNEWTFLVDELTKAGFSHEVLIEAGLATRSKNNKVFDRFRNRLMWPIFSASGEPIGFGARRLTDDKTEAKWLNTSETPIYKKSEVLYGIHSARKPISSDKKIVIVEGYGDVMACHIAGIPHAVAASGTSFGEGHIRIIRRLFRDEDFQGKIVFTFDGDEAGLTAARRAFPIINKIGAQALVAVAPDGMDPLDLRNSQGDKSLVELVESAIPLVEFVIKHAIEQFDLSDAEARLAALRAAANYILEIRDVTLRDFYVRKTAGWVGMPESAVASTINSVSKNRKNETTWEARTPPQTAEQSEVSAAKDFKMPDTNNPKNWDQREILKLLVQAETVPHVDLYPDVFSEPTYREIFAAWYSLELNTNEPYRQIQEKLAESHHALLNSLVVEPLLTTGETQRNLEMLANRILAAHMTERKTRLKAEMATATPERTSELLSELTQVDKFIRDLRRV